MTILGPLGRILFGAIFILEWKARAAGRGRGSGDAVIR